MRRAFLALAALLLAASPAQSFSGATPAPPAVVVADDPCDVRSTAEGDWVATAAGTALAIGSSVRPRSGGELSLSVGEGITVHLGAGSSAALAPRAWVPGELGVNGGKPVHAAQFVLHGGELTTHISPGGEARAVLVTSGTSQAADWRGTLRVSVASDSSVLAAAIDGAALVGSNGRWLSIYAGSGAVLRAKAAPDTHHTLVAAPAWSTTDSSTPFSLVQGGAPASFTLAWAPVDRAVRYRVQVASDPLFTHVLSTTDAGTSTRVTTGALPPGRYFVSLDAAGVDGMYGLPSAVRPLRVASMTLPPEAAVARDGAIVLPERSAITLDDAAGLELAMQPVTEHRVALPTAALTYQPAPARLTLGNERQAIMYVRDSATGTVTNLTLARRELRARVEVGPRTARWPENEVTAKVILEDPTGRVDVSQEAPKLRVKINVDEVKVDWTRAGNEWSCRIPQAIPPGPWLVSVVADDRAGNEIGAGYLEVDGPAPPTHGERGADKTEVRIIH